MREPRKRNSPTKIPPNFFIRLRFLAMEGNNGNFAIDFVCKSNNQCQSPPDFGCKSKYSVNRPSIFILENFFKRFVNKSWHRGQKWSINLGIRAKMGLISSLYIQCSQNRVSTFTDWYCLNLWDWEFGGGCRFWNFGSWRLHFLEFRLLESRTRTYSKPQL